MQPVKAIVVERVPTDGAIFNRPSSDVGAGLVVLHEVSADEWTPSCAHTDVSIAVNEKARAIAYCSSVDDAVVGKMETVEGILIEVEESAAADLTTAVNRVLMDGDVRPGVVEEDTVAGEPDDAVVE